MKKIMNWAGFGKSKKKEKSGTESGDTRNELSQDGVNHSENPEDISEGLSDVKTGEENLVNENGEHRYIKLKGFPDTADENDITEFLADCNIVENIVIFENGHAYVKLVGQEDQSKALKFDKSYFRRWFIRIDKSDGSIYNKLNRKVIEVTEEEMMETLQEPPKSTTYIKLSGLPWKTSEKEISKFLVDCNIVGNVMIIKNEHGKPSGDAVVKLMEKSDLEKAHKCHKKYIHERFIEIEEIESDTFNKLTEGEKTQETAFSKLSGLVWTATEEDIKNFLHDCKIREVVITTNERGKPSGNAFVHFASKDDTEKAKAHNRENLRERFVIVEEIEEQEFIKETENDRKSNQPSKNYSSSHVKLTSLPRKYSELDIRNFLKNCAIRKVIINSSGNSSGEAIVEVESSDDQARALICHNSSMGGRMVAVDKVEKMEVSKLKGEKIKTIKFCVKPKGTVDGDDVMEECKEIEIDGVTWGSGNFTQSVDKKSVIELECTVRDDLEAEDIKREIEKLTDFVERVEILRNEKCKTSFVLDKVAFTFEIMRFWDNVSNTEEVLEDCKDVDIKGVIWDKGEIIPVSDSKSKIKLGCIVEECNTDAEEIRKKLEELKSVEDVKIIQ
eukprot:GFUD01015299.1.p1 GENE.GFUD01015299.1~~GFUD01015299.1.p1  ORF type:complete len:615 (+),score=191.67 GFUD01015299.1:130-1974(+)